MQNPTDDPGRECLGPAVISDWGRKLQQVLIRVRSIKRWESFKAGFNMTPVLRSPAGQRVRKMLRFVEMGCNSYWAGLGKTLLSQEHWLRCPEGGQEHHPNKTLLSVHNIVSPVSISSLQIWAFLLPSHTSDRTLDRWIWELMERPHSLYI